MAATESILYPIIFANVVTIDTFRGECLSLDSAVVVVMEGSKLGCDGGGGVEGEEVEVESWRSGDEGNREVLRYSCLEMEIASNGGMDEEGEGNVDRGGVWIDRVNTLEAFIKPL